MAPRIQLPNGLDTIYGTAETLAGRVEALTEGRFRIRSYPAGELVPAFEVLSAVQNGTIQMGHSASYYFQGKNPALVFDCTIPFGLSARQLNAWFYYGDGLTLTREMFADFNVINFPGGNTGTQMGGWFRREIGSLQDLRGLKMRIPGLGGEVMNRLDVTVQVIPGGEIYLALERGAIDATEWVGPYDDEKLGFQEIVKDYYYPGVVGTRTRPFILREPGCLGHLALCVPGSLRNSRRRSQRAHAGIVRCAERAGLAAACGRRRATPSVSRRGDDGSKADHGRIP